MNLKTLTENWACTEAQLWFTENFGTQASTQKVLLRAIDENHLSWVTWYIYNGPEGRFKNKALEFFQPLILKLIKSECEPESRKLLTALMDVSKRDAQTMVDLGWRCAELDDIQGVIHRNPEEVDVLYVVKAYLTLLTATGADVREDVSVLCDEYREAGCITKYVKVLKKLVKALYK